MVKWSILFESFPCEEIKLKTKQLSIKLELRLSYFISNRYNLTTVLTAVNQGKSRFDTVEIGRVMNGGHRAKPGQSRVEPKWYRMRSILLVRFMVIHECIISNSTD